MVKFNRFLIANAMLIANLLAVWSSALISFFLTENLTAYDQQILDLGWEYGPFLDCVYFMVVGGLTIWYELPIRRALKMMKANIPADPNLALKARQRLLNEPYIIAAMDFIFLIAIGLAIIVFFIYKGIGPLSACLEGIDLLLTALITVTAAFFILQYILQKKLAPIFFPDGRLSTVPGTQKTMIRKTLLSLSFALNLIPLSIIIFTHLNYAYKVPGAFEQNPLLASLSYQIIILSVIFVCLGVLLTLIVSRNLSRSLSEITRVLKKIGHGDLNSKIQVTTNDEIGYTGDVINEMREGLKEREHLRHSMAIAHEVQQLLLPKVSPEIQGVDIAGRSVYCEETGGDYYDFLQLGPKGSGKIGVVVGDISGHGIGSALLMSSARALLRMRSIQAGTLSQIVNDVNRELSNDFGDSGQFLTLFYLVMEPGIQRLTWIRAGHEPAIVYTPQTDAFTELKGSGIPIGVDEDWQYQEEIQTGQPENQIVLLSTDGIWEARNAEGKMFGKDPIYELIRQNAKQSSEQILEGILTELKHFQRGISSADDVTLVVIKI